jgi:hypothetical protein
VGCKGELPFPQYFFFPALWMVSGRWYAAVYLASAGVSRRSVEHVPGKGSYRASVIMIPSCREVIYSRNRTVSPLPVAQRIRREVTQSVETQTEHKLPGRHQHKPRDLATSKTNSDRR